MAPDDQSGGARPAGPVVLRIKLRYDDVDTMVQRFASNVGKSGLFLPTKSIQPIGTEVKFELRLANDSPVLVGLGRVKFVKPPDPRAPKAAFGMAIELMRVSREGREIIIRMIERRRALGLPEVAIPIPDDHDSARRGEVETQPRIDTSGIVREAMRDFASAPVQEQVLTGTPPADSREAARASTFTAEPTPPPAAPPPLTDIDPAAAEIAAAKAAAVAEEIAAAKAAAAAAAAEEAAKIARRSSTTPPPIRESGPSFTAPRAGTGPIAAVTAEAARSVPVLAPEPPRAKRPRAAELMAKATELSERLAAVELSDLEHQQVDIERALARARALAGSDLEGELASLRDSVSAPVEISIEAASAELARQLGGKAITKRERSSKWAAPLAPVEVRADASAPVSVPPAAPGDGFVVKTRAATEASSTRAREAVPAMTTDHIETRPVTMPVAEVVRPVVEAPVRPVIEAPVAAPPVIEALVAAQSAVEVPANHVVPVLETRSAIEAASSVEAALAELVTASEPALASEAASAPRVELEEEPGAAEPVAVAPYVLTRDDKTPIPTGDEYVDAMVPPGSEVAEPADDLGVERRSFGVADEAQLHTQPGANDAAMLQRALEGSTPSLALDESDLESLEEEEDRGERTTIGTFPIDPRAFAGHGGSTQPDTRFPRADSFADELEAQLDRQLAEAEAEADDDLRDLAAGRRSEPAYTIEPYVRRDSVADPQGFESEPVPLVRASSIAEEVSDLDVVAEADAADADPMHAGRERDGYDAAGYEQPAANYAADEQAADEGGYDAVGYEQPAANYDEAPGYAESDYPDDPRDAAAAQALAALEGLDGPSERPSQEDFASRLDLDDEPDPEESRRFPTANPRPGHPAFQAADSEPDEDEFPNPPSTSYTFAEPFPPAANEAVEFDEPHDFSKNTPVPATRSRTPSRAPAPAPAPVPVEPPAEDLENALAALDVDLDPDLQQQRRARRSSASQQRPLPGLPIHRPGETGGHPVARPAKPPTMPPPIPTAARTKLPTAPAPVQTRVPKRASTDDGILIDFDDDE